MFVFSFFFSLCCVQQCSSFFSLPFLSFSIVRHLFSFSFFLINCSFTIFSNLISASLWLYLNITTIGSCLPAYSISNNISIKQVWFINKTFSIIFFLLSASTSTKTFLHFYLFRKRQHNTSFCLLSKMS